MSAPLGERKYGKEESQCSGEAIDCGKIGVALVLDRGRRNEDHQAYRGEVLRPVIEVEPVISESRGEGGRSVAQQQPQTKQQQRPQAVTIGQQHGECAPG